MARRRHPSKKDRRFARQQRRIKQRAAARQAAAAPVTAEIEASKLGYPGAHINLVVLPTRLDEPDSHRQERLRDSSLRKFQVQLDLGRQPKLTDEAIEFGRPDKLGDSFIQSASDAVMGVAGSDGERASFSLVRNKNGRLASAETVVDARSPNLAMRSASNKLSPFLSVLAFEANVPLCITKITCTDLGSGAMTMSFVTPYSVRNFDPTAVTVSGTLAPCFALYREALNAANVLYRFLCLVKVMEGLYCSIRPTLRKIGKDHAITLPTRKELVPEPMGVIVESPQNEFVGQPVKQVYDAVLVAKYRNALAHFTLDGKPPWNLDNYDERAEIGNLLPYVEQMVRTLLASDLEVVASLRAAGIDGI